VLRTRILSNRIWKLLRFENWEKKTLTSGIDLFMFISEVVSISSLIKQDEKK
jgi:hypothetical protein